MTIQNGRDGADGEAHAASTLAADNGDDDDSQEGSHIRGRAAGAMAGGGALPP